MHFTIYTFILLLGDLGTKYAATLLLEERISIIGDMLYLELIHNTGIAFSIPVQGFLLQILTISLIFGIFYYYFFSGYEKRSFLKDTAIGLILAGALGNGYERIFQGYVVDFIGMQYFAVFNIADSYITAGALLFLWIYWRSEAKEDKQ